LTSERRKDQVTSREDIIAMADAEKNYYGRWDLMFCLWPWNKATEFWMAWWDIPSAVETEIPKVLYQDHIDNFFLLSRCSAQRIHTRGKNSKWRIL
jgi:hypothetical protein